MLKITADLFSGLPNPEWLVEGAEAASVLHDLATNRHAVASADSGFTGLGFRGLVVETLDEHSSDEFSLPTKFRLANGGSLNESKSHEVAERLISRMTASTAANHPSILNRDYATDPVKNYLLQALKEPRKKSVVSTVEPEGETQETADAAHLKPGIKLPPIFVCAYETTPFNPAFWNDPAHISKNNCYNYASNRRTDTFAQPGRATGHMYSVINCAEVTNGAVSDGASLTCAPASQAPRWYMALVIAPGPGFVDFHWYRKAKEGFWGHKPGGTAARNTDNSGHIVNDPRTADRGPYTIFCRFMYAQNKMVVK